MSVVHFETGLKAIDLLSENGKLIKRPVVLTNKVGLVGFKPDEWLKVV